MGFGIYKQGQEKYPVVYVSYEDMQAYSKWLRRDFLHRLNGSWQPREMISVSGPGGKNFMVHTVYNSFDRPNLSTHSQKGRALAEHLIWWAMYGRWWMICISMEQTILRLCRGGSYYKPDSSWWYIQGGPQSLDKTQIFLIGFTRLWTEALQ